MTLGINKHLNYEFYINTDYGMDTWHHNLDKWRDALEDFIKYKDTKGFCLEIQITDEEGCGFVMIYPTNQTDILPKYVQKAVNKVLKEAA
tara:strand:+ start:306 stop:575 length:270 start_codon:yes stop_codon:yes gene_type:complete